MTEIGTFRLTLPGPMLQRGFWLHVWKVVAVNREEFLYVGRTGDNSSPNASPPYIRMGQHLGSKKNQNALRRNLASRGIQPEACRTFDLIAHGPIHPEVVKPENFDHTNKEMRQSLMDQHMSLRNIVGAMEKRLAVERGRAGYTVLNAVKWKHNIDEVTWIPVRRAFADDFPKLRALA